MSDECNLEGCFNGNQWVAIIVSFCITLFILLLFVSCSFSIWRCWRSKRDKIVSLGPALDNVKKEKDDALNRSNIHRNDLRDGSISLRAELDNVKKERDTALNRLNIHSNNLRGEIIRLRAELDKVEKEKVDALNRLSEKMSIGIRDGNPSITDLSDENRPSRLGPKFSELYDNEWTNAADELEAGRADKENEELTKKIAGLLLDIVKFSFEVCREVAGKQLLLIQQMIIEPSLSQDGVWPNSHRNMRYLPKEFMKRVKDQRGSVMPDLTRVTNMVQSRINDTYSEGEFGKCLSGEQVQKYMRSSIHLIWLMNVQDPPMFLNFAEVSPEQLRPYMKSGPVVDYHVWPSLYLYDGGPIMKKGVAQFKKPDDETDENLIRL